MSQSLTIPPEEYHWQAVRASGPGGQNVNKVASAVQLQFDIHASSLPQAVKQRLLSCQDRRISKAGVVTIKAQRFRQQERNLADAVDRLHHMAEQVATPPAPRRKTRPSRAAKARRLKAKAERGAVKRLRTKPSRDD